MFSGFLDYDTTFSLLKKRVPSVFLPSIISSRPPVAIIYMSCQNLFLPLMPHFALHLWNISTHGHRIHLPRISGAHHDYNRVRFDILGWNAISHLHNTLYPFHVTRHCHQLSLPTVISHVPMPLGGTVFIKKKLCGIWISEGCHCPYLLSCVSTTSYVSFITLYLSSTHLYPRLLLFLPLIFWCLYAALPILLSPSLCISFVHYPKYFPPQLVFQHW